MKRRVKIKIDDKNDTIIFVPYKNGIVEWKVAWLTNYTYRMILINRPITYNPKRVERAHNQFLEGKMLRTKIDRACAATHNWHLLNKFRDAFDYQERMNAVNRVGSHMATIS